MPMEDNLERIANPVLQREDLTPIAREPRDETDGAGFGSYYQGPEVETEDEPVLSTEELKPVNGQLEPTRTTYTTSETGWKSHESRDFRREDADYGLAEMDPEGSE